MLVLLTGATGYVGGRLLRALEEQGRPVRCFARRPEAVTATAETTEIVAGDIREQATLGPALRGVDTAYYLVHSMGSRGDFVEEDRAAARAFGEAAAEEGVGQIVYLGGLGSGPGLSPHLESRQEVGRILRDSGVPTIELRAAVVLGSGSLSFELLRSLVDRLPVMVTPRWVRTVSQPIAIEDLLAYLVAALDAEPGVYEIGGADRASYEDLMREYARQQGLSRAMIPVPVLTPRLSSLWLGLVSPLYARVGRKLIDSLPHETVITDDRARKAFPAIEPRGYREALARALANEDREFAETRWSDSSSSAELRDRHAGHGYGKRLVDSRTAEVDAPPPAAFAPVRRIGGSTGWYFGNWLWHVRGLADLLVGGPGVRRGRRDPERPIVGGTIDFWRVEAYEPDRLLRLRAEMRLPGRAWLQFEADGEAGVTRLTQTAVFDPAGLAGLAYWWLLFPVHALIFSRMLRRIARAGGPAC